MVEGRNRARRQRQRSRRAIGDADDDMVIDEVEFDRKGSRAVRQRPGRQAAAGHMEGDTPRLIDGRRLGERHFTNDLHPHVQRRIGVLPFVVR